ncbi:MAG: magnesium transporter [Kordiimonadaceae bacterium]|nr:magnesium transporter [Kordiimonadaceae bacterium]
MVDEPQKAETNGHASKAVDQVETPQTDVHLSKEFVQSLRRALKAGEEKQVLKMLEEVHAADVADILEVLPSSQRRALIALIGDSFDPEVLSEVEGEAQDDLYEHMPNEQIAVAVTELETDDAVYVIEELDAKDREDVMRKLAADDRVAIEESLSYPEDSAGRMMQRDLVAVPEFWTVGQTIDYLRSDSPDVPTDFFDVFVMNPSHHLVGSVSLPSIMRTQPSVALNTIMEAEPYFIEVNADQEEVAHKFTKYHLISAAVVDESHRLVGVITVDDVVDVIEEEAEEDILALAGVSEESGLNESFIEITKGALSGCW